ncbi:3-deoxy-D-manno-octulosonic acid transferase [Aggregatimonas sangjinii]|uniref:3-deoxy-D-manno-octulosonic acid transferase n=1 Tax=Aggregatimonas sangjinii TaxID=2583587 RepID=A0A5B7SWG0_9FLAO|nr:glycosyltransferase N-terminal domain-containing protein [Aggregatimonas sangjinii]QCX01281.1 3-deoxy-D-manno-octulosonic acid transferase [Aggregatimonas sangjinii]
MHFIYNLIVQISWFHLKVVALFHPKIKLFVTGRKNAMGVLKQAFSKGDNVIWMHVASLGEFEQGLPVIEKLKEAYANHKILITFFSPSGYEIKKDTSVADTVVYLPMDSRKNVTEFLDVVAPSLAIFVKYEIWPNYLRALRGRKIPAILISAIFNEKQIYFKGYGGFMRKALSSFSHYFVQNDISASLLKSVGITEVTVCGDTRLDRVSEILERDNHLDFMEDFKQDRSCFVAGSTWPEDEAILIDYINHSPKNLKFVLAPHTIKIDKILGLAGALTKKTALYSKRANQDLADYDVLIIDHIGLLTKVYSYADFAYVGGGFATGLHNTLEPAVFGVPVIIGPNYHGFQEAEALVALKGILPIGDKWSFGELMKRLLDNPELRKKTGEINATYITKNKGASVQIMQYIRTLI